MSPNSGWNFAERNLHRTLANDPVNASDMRSFVSDFLTGASVPEHVIDEILMAVGEVVANACRHGRPANGHGTVDLRCELANHHLIVTIADDGPGFDAARVLQARVPDVLSQGGRGFFLMRQLMDRVEVESDERGTTVLLERQLPR